MSGTTALNPHPKERIFGLCSGLRVGQMAVTGHKLQEMGKKKPSPWWNQGIRFECQLSGNCCTSRGEYGYVYLTRKDRKNLAEFFKMTTREFTTKYCARTDGFYHLVENGSPECIYLSEKKCTVYDARPTQCRTWPFWPENMSAKKWSGDIQSLCPGVGKGKLHSAEFIGKQIKRQKKADLE